MKSDITTKSVLLSDTGGSLDIIRDGEVLASIAVPAGRISASQYLDLVPDGAGLFVGSGLSVLEPRNRIGIQPYGFDSHASGANPDFKPTSASRLELEMRVTMRKMQSATDRIEARERALAQIERVPKAPPVAPPAYEDETPVVGPALDQ